MVEIGFVSLRGLGDAREVELNPSATNQKRRPP